MSAAEKALAALESELSKLPLSEHDCANESAGCERCANEFAEACQRNTSHALALVKDLIQERKENDQLCSLLRAMRDSTGGINAHWIEKIAGALESQPSKDTP